jgi:aminoglycoside phosphotransferase (APT) family kinase protein
VLTWRPRGTVADLVEPTAAVEALRRSGYPAPRTELVEQVGDSVVVVQELLPGRVVTHVSGELFEQALALNALQEGALADRRDLPLRELYLTRDGPGFCLHGPLAEHSERSRLLLSWVRDVGAGHSEMTADDVAHFDFQPSNMLADDGLLTGIVDWDGAGRGDRRLDLVTLRFGVHAAEVDVDEGVIQRLDRLLDAMPPNVLRPAWAHMSLRQVDWAIRHFTAAEVDHWLDLTESRAADRATMSR